MLTVVWARDVLNLTLAGGIAKNNPLGKRAKIQSPG